MKKTGKFRISFIIRRGIAPLGPQTLPGRIPQKGYADVCDEDAYFVSGGLDSKYPIPGLEIIYSGWLGSFSILRLRRRI